MRLIGLEFFAVAPPPPGWGGRHWQIVRLTTDDGITGAGRGLMPAPWASGPCKR